MTNPDTANLLPPEVLETVRARLRMLYADRGDACLRSLLEVVAKYPRSTSPGAWTERDVVLITYADQVQHPHGSALPALTEFLADSGLTKLINTVHLLPFFPFTSDDGFSVADYRQVQAEVGSWDDVRRLSAHARLMFDLVLNHCSQQHRWFQDYLRGQEPYTRYFHEVSPTADVSQVTRPRSLPLLTRFETSRGARHVWTTFSADQVDLNFGAPEVLVDFIDILLFFVSQGARIIRLDAVAFLWKELGTSCIHLPQTHEVVKLMRDVLGVVAPDVWIITETNVPHAENVSYFGQGDEAHLVYQFSLPPLLLDAFLCGDATQLRNWLADLKPPPAGTTFFNFTASHDGVGVRPLEGLVPAERVDRLVQAAVERGSLVGMKRNPDGTDTPYELNIAYVDALGDEGLDVASHARRFLSSQAVMLSLPGIPGIYFHSLVGTQNDHAGATQSGIPRRINRRKFQLAELRSELANGESLQAAVFDGYQHLLGTRIAQPAFHPDGSRTLVDLADAGLLAFERRSPRGDQRILCITNFASSAKSLALSEPGYELLGGKHLDAGSTQIEPSQTMWIKREGKAEEYA